MGHKVLHGGYTRIEMDLFRCSGPLRSVRKCRSALRQIIGDHRMTMRKTLGDSYGNASYIFFVTLEESFILIETWPEIGLVKLIIDLCNFSQNNAQRARGIAAAIAKMFGASQYKEWIRNESGVAIDSDDLAQALAANG